MPFFAENRLKSSKRVKFRLLPRAILAAVCEFCPSPLRGDAIDRLKPAYLKSLHEATEAFRHDRQTVSLPSPFTDYRGVMHVHSLLSHDSRSKLEEIIAAAKKVGVKVICFTEHPNPPRDYIKEGHRGLVDGVLLIPGYEFNGLLAFPKQSIPLGSDADPQARVDSVRKTGGQAFLCHLEERMDWDLKNLTGSEIYNLHADFKDETRLDQVDAVRRRAAHALAGFAPVSAGNNGRPDGLSGRLFAPLRRTLPQGTFDGNRRQRFAPQ